MKFVKNIVLFIIFGVIYCGIEMIWRGHTDISMGIVGGLAALIIGSWNEKTELPLLPSCFAGMILITLFECVSGIILNVWLGLNIWDYSKMPMQFFWGQCCVPYCVLWFFLSGAVILLDDWLRAVLFNKNKNGMR